MRQLCANGNEGCVYDKVGEMEKEDFGTVYNNANGCLLLLRIFMIMMRRQTYDATYGEKPVRKRSSQASCLFATYSSGAGQVFLVETNPIYK